MKHVKIKKTLTTRPVKEKRMKLSDEEEMGKDATSTQTQVTDRDLEKCRIGTYIHAKMDNSVYVIKHSWKTPSVHLINTVRQLERLISGERVNELRLETDNDAGIVDSAVIENGELILEEIKTFTGTEVCPSSCQRALRQLKRYKLLFEDVVDILGKSPLSLFGKTVHKHSLLPKVVKSVCMRLTRLVHKHKNLLRVKRYRIIYISQRLGIRSVALKKTFVSCKIVNQKAED